MKIGAIVEGHGDVQALPALLRRLGRWLSPDLLLDVPPPMRVPRDPITRADTLRRPLELMANKGGKGAPLLIVLDGDDDCPAELGPRIAALARGIRPDREIGVVVAHREFEAWFLAGAASLRGERGLSATLDAPADPEAVRDAKGWLSDRMAQPYSPRVDQEALARRLDLDLALPRSPSLRKLAREAHARAGARRGPGLSARPSRPPSGATAPRYPVLHAPRSVTVRRHDRAG